MRYSYIKCENRQAGGWLVPDKNNATNGFLLLASCGKMLVKVLLVGSHDEFNDHHHILFENYYLPIYCLLKMHTDYFFLIRS